jgi:hypothetical protein
MLPALKGTPGAVLVMAWIPDQMLKPRLLNVS